MLSSRPCNKRRRVTFSSPCPSQKKSVEWQPSGMCSLTSIVAASPMLQRQRSQVVDSTDLPNFPVLQSSKKNNSTTADILSLINKALQEPSSAMNSASNKRTFDDLGYEDLGYGEESPAMAAPRPTESFRMRAKRRCSVTKFNLQKTIEAVQLADLADDES